MLLQTPLLTEQDFKKLCRLIQILILSMHHHQSILMLRSSMAILTRCVNPELCAPTQCFSVLGKSSAGLPLKVLTVRKRWKKSLLVSSTFFFSLDRIRTKSLGLLGDSLHACDGCLHFDRK